MNDQNNNFNQNGAPENPYNYGASAPSSNAMYQQPVQAQAPAHNEPRRGEAIKAMVFGIIAAYCAWFPLLSIAGIIFGAIAKKRGSAIMLASPSSRATYNFAKAGRITGMVGFIAGIIMTVIWAIYFIILYAVLAIL